MIILYVFLFLIVASVAMAAPAWKKQPATAPAKTTTTTTTAAKPTVIYQNVTQVIVQNNTGQEKESGMDWNLVGGVAAIIALAAAAVGWFLSRKERGMTSKYIREIDRSFNEFRDNTSKCESVLYNIKEKIEKDFSKGKINDSAFSILDARLDKYLSDVRKGVIGSQFKLTEANKKELDNMLEDGVITEKEYERFKKMKISELPAGDRKKLQSLMKKWEGKKK